MKKLADVLSEQPPIWPESLLDQIRVQNEQLNRTIVVLDDDPTGTQTVYDVPVLTQWSVEDLANEFQNQTPLFFVLTNTRGCTQQQAQHIAAEIGRNLSAASKQSNREFEVISRSDSTLRGHYPAEVDPLAQEIGLAEAPHILIPFFLEGGRLTIQDEHYVVENEMLVPASATPFAKDAVFGFSTSNMKQWVAEKTNNRIAAENVVSISLEDLRTHGPDAVATKLRNTTPGSAVIVNAIEMRDLEVFTAGAINAADAGPFLYRTAASFVQVAAGLAPKPLLKTEELVETDSSTGGLIVVGSYVPKTTQQLQHLQSGFPDLNYVELSVANLIDRQHRDREIESACTAVQDSIARGTDTCLFTSRELVKESTDEGNMKISEAVSSAIVDIVSATPDQPKFLIAKGGITSSDVATQALGVKRAVVAGQILPGVPVWRLAEESKYPSMSYVIFPGNVGDETALSQAYQRVSQQ